MKKPPKKRKRGGQTTLTPRRAETLLTYIAQGQYLDASASMSGVHVTTVRRWVQRGEDEVARVGETVDDPELLITNWLDDFDDDFRADNPMWVIDPPDGFNPDEWIFALFAHRYERARALAEVTAVENIRAAARSGAWQADAWYLERTRWQKYGRKDQVSHQGVEGGPAIQTHSVEGLLQRVEAITAAQNGELK